MLNTIDLVGRVIAISRTYLIDDTSVVDCTIGIVIDPQAPTHPDGDANAIIKARTWGCDAIRAAEIKQGQDIRFTISEMTAGISATSRPLACVLIAEISNVWPATN
jgi:hypothetical protein